MFVNRNAFSFVAVGSQFQLYNYMNRMNNVCVIFNSLGWLGNRL